MNIDLSRRAAWLLAAVMVAVGAVAIGAVAEAQSGTGAVETVATFDSASPTENITETTDRTIVVTGMDDHVLWKVVPGKAPVKVPMPPGVVAVVGVAPSNNGGVVVTATEKSFRRPGQTPAIDFSDVGPMVMVLDRTGKVLSTTRGAKGQFFNGIASVGGSQYLIGDNASGTVWEFDRTTKRLAVWLKDPSVPRPNGVKLLNGWVYLSTGGGLQRVQIEKGRPKGMPIVIAKDARGDDFALTRDGTAYFPLATSIMRVSAHGEISTFRDNVQGGPAAWISRDDKWLYWPTRGGTEPQRLLRIAIP